MLVTLNSQHLAAELRLLAKIVPAKPAVAILSHALLTASDGELQFYATDLEVALGTRCAASVDLPGETTLPVAKLLQIAEQLPDDDVSIEVEKAQATIRCGAFTSRLRALPVDDFPEPPQPEGQGTVLDAAALRLLIDRTRHATSAAATKYVLKGSLLACAGGVAAMVATEGKRLALATVSIAGPDLSLVIPAKALDVIAGGVEQGDVQVTVGDRHLFFAYDRRLLTSRKLDGEFPAYRRIIPTENNLKVSVNRSMLAAALRRVVLAAEENGAVYFDVAPGQLEITAASVGVGSANETVPVNYDGQPLKVCINGNYVLDFLNAASEETVTLALKDAKAAALLTAGVDHVGVIMLMRA